MPGAAQTRIYDLASEQNGYFTAVQARLAGITKQAIHNLTTRGSLERVSHGLYRLVHFPDGPMDPYVEATLWPLSIRGVISHETALALYGLSDANPARIHLTVPRTWRLRREVPKRLALHHIDLHEDDVNIYEGVPVTTPERTIRDCDAARLGAALVRQAIVDGRRTGHLRVRQAQKLERELLGGTGP
ncbi:type IV toxin-antitoxin system AbiEi family antitoxin domain-containing protein [Longimicrobium sp.]|uniref:type IV toxin-antitoxin system AbiEi family antitoxin domain-containing protein n=1 Tax=Longimicrobium sp. TaxID=2029185 RepID=UPI002E309BF8|nr:type IV toxin-antitoxin system AbiEi family antitoxin domain-containing protein [Longimicrobium sp.]HEX6038847.1 type IV toxin-antitoxin system AbiEi family antitoxin domain-containing protein [Longimicrobium sp.]